MDVTTTLIYIILGAVLGMAGQSIRVIIGIKKNYEKAALKGEKTKDWFDPARLLISLLIGFVTGILAVIYLWDVEIDRLFLLSIIATGYSETDFIERIIKRYIPETEEKK